MCLLMFAILHRFIPKIFSTSQTFKISINSQRFFGLSCIYIKDSQFYVSAVHKYIYSIAALLSFFVEQTVSKMDYQGMNLIYACSLFIAQAIHAGTVLVVVIYFHNEHKLCGYLKQLTGIDNDLRQLGINTIFLKTKSIFTYNVVFTLTFVLSLEFTMVKSVLKIILIIYVFLAESFCENGLVVYFHIIKTMFY